MAVPLHANRLSARFGGKSPWCDRYSECPQVTKVYGDRVIDIEYTDDLRGSFASVCARPNTPSDTILRDRELTPRGSADYTYRHC